MRVPISLSESSGPQPIVRRREESLSCWVGFGLAAGLAPRPPVHSPSLAVGGIIRRFSPCLMRICQRTDNVVPTSAAPAHMRTCSPELKPAKRDKPCRGSERAELPVGPLQCSCFSLQFLSSSSRNRCFLFPILIVIISAEAPHPYLTIFSHRHLAKLHFPLFQIIRDLRCSLQV